MFYIYYSLHFIYNTNQMYALLDLGGGIDVIMLTYIFKQSF